MADTSVKYFHSEMPGAPILSGTPGTVIAILDACLVNGWGLITADSVVITNNIATFKRASGISYEAGQVVTITGATVSDGSINGEQRISSVSSTTFSFATTGLSNQTATGSITSKIAPATWNKPYSGANKGVYKPSDVTATGCLLRVDDSSAKVARVVGYETMTDVDTGVGQFPTASQQSGGPYWCKSSTADSAPRKWMVIADSKMFYFCREYYPNAYPGMFERSAFGDTIPTKTGDAWHCVISGVASDRSTSAVSSADCYDSSTTGTSPIYTPRAYTGLGSSMAMYKQFPLLYTTGSGGDSGAIYAAPLFPNATDGGLYVVPHYVFDSVGPVFRGVSPGLWCCPMRVPAGSFSAKDKVTGVTGLVGKTLWVVTTYGDGSAYARSPVFFDITGPWR